MLAQLETIPATTLKYAVLLAFALLVAAGIAVGIWANFKKTSVAIEPQPVEVRKAAKRYDHELITQRFTGIDHRLDGHDRNFTELWGTMRSEDAALRDEMNRCFKDIERALGRIEGKLNREL